MFIKGQILLLILNIGYVHTSAPKIVSKSAPRDFRTVPEDFNGTLFRLHITDPDQGDNIIVVPNNDLTRKYLYIIQTPSTGNDVTVNVTVTQPLDRESSELGDSFEVKLQIKDDTGNVIGYKFSVFIDDINDNSPVFVNIPYKLDIPELPCNKTVVYDNIHATDKDKNANGRVTYSMEPKAQSEEVKKLYSDTFSIDPKTGKVTLKQCLDYENNSYYQFNITAKDQGPNGGHRTTIDFTIRVYDVQDRPPWFDGIPYFKNIHEGISPGTSILQVNARDGDPGVSNKIYFNITQSSCGIDLFSINSTNGVITVASTIDSDKGLVKNTSGRCILTVSATEIVNPNDIHYGRTTTFANVTIHVQDIDDNPPQFSSTNYTTSVYEGATANCPILRIPVVDIDQGDNAFMSFILENLDGTPSTDFVVSPTEIESFGIVSILVKNPNLDYDVFNDITIRLIAIDKYGLGRTSMTTITVNILKKDGTSHQNIYFDHRKFSFSIEENSQNGTVVSSITAKPTGRCGFSNVMQYFLFGGEERFTVDKESGVIRTRCKHCFDELDREKRDVYFMTLFATDLGGNHGSTEVVVSLTDVNDNNPTFAKPYYTKFIEENSKDLDIVQLEAVDMDKPYTNNSKMSFHIINISDKSLWNNISIDENTGLLSLQTPVDYEALQVKGGIVRVNVAVTDLGSPMLSSTCDVYITIQDENDNPPNFSAALYRGKIIETATSNSSQGLHIIQVYATDDDVTEYNRKISYFQIEGSMKFDLNTSTGMISLRANAKLDRRAEPTYILKVLAIDQGSPPLTATATVIIDVTDVNDLNKQPSEPPFVG